MAPVRLLAVSCYAPAAWLSFALTLAQALPLPASRRRRLPCLFPASLALTLYAFRWPVFFHRPELNPDEAMTVAGAITLRAHPLYWHSVDGTTHGPLNDFALLLTQLIGLPVGLASARFMGALLASASLICFWLGARRFWGETAARLAVLPPLAFFAFSTYWDFVQYSSEHVSLCLLSLAWAAPGGAVAGLALGAVPFAKLQAVPIAAGLAAWIFIRRPAAGFALGLILPAAVCASYLSLGRLWEPFWQAYIVNNLRYATQTKMFTFAQMFEGLPLWSAASEGLVPYVLGVSAFVLFGFGRADFFRRCDWTGLALAGVILALSLYAITAPGRQYGHYLLLAILPLAAVSTAVLSSALRARGGPRPRDAGRTTLISAFLILTLTPQILAKLHRPDPYLADVLNPPSISAVAKEILHCAHPGEPLAIWGWMSRYYVETGMPQATRDGDSERQMLPHPQQAYYRRRYMSDLERSNAPVFLDAVGSQAIWPHDRAHFAHETWPALNAWVSRHYRQVAEIDTVRIYVRRDRLIPSATGSSSERVPFRTPSPASLPK